MVSLRTRTALLVYWEVVDRQMPMVGVAGLLPTSSSEPYLGFKPPVVRDGKQGIGKPPIHRPEQLGGCQDPFLS